MAVASTLTYFDTATITPVISFIVPRGVSVIKLVSFIADDEAK